MGVMITREIVTLKEAMALCKVSRRTVYNWVQMGKVEVASRPREGVRIFKDTLFKPMAKLLIEVDE